MSELGLGTSLDRICFENQINIRTVDERGRDGTSVISNPSEATACKVYRNSSSIILGVHDGRKTTTWFCTAVYVILINKEHCRKKQLWIWAKELQPFSTIFNHSVLTDDSISLWHDVNQHNILFKCTNIHIYIYMLSHHISAFLEMQNSPETETRLWNVQWEMSVDTLASPLIQMSRNPLISRDYR